ncbi:MAG TPA: DUF3291 domain-containing protein [Vicinamibacterales bacterium]|nr:DUF3291 domain-containing protein [Vicinamibacterales bacterium]
MVNTQVATALHLAEINIARTRASLDDPLMADFVAQLEGVNRIADASAGFVWRLKADDGGASSYVRFSEDDRVIVNMSVWLSVEALRAYVYRTHEHAAVFRDRAKWFEPFGGPQLALWWIPAGHIPSLDEGRRRLALLERDGPTAEAFTFKHMFAAPGSASDLHHTETRRH